VLLHGHHADPLSWLVEQEVLTTGLTVQPLASREPLVLSEDLVRAGFRTLPEQPAAWMKRTADGAVQPVELLVIQRPMGCRLPLALSGLLPEVKRLLTPVGLAAPRQFTAKASWNGWQLLAPAG